MAEQMTAQRMPDWLLEAACLKNGHRWDHFTTETHMVSMVRRQAGNTTDQIMWSDSDADSGYAYPTIMWNHRRCEQCGKHQITTAGWLGPDHGTLWLTVEEGDG